MLRSIKIIAICFAALLFLGGVSTEIANGNNETESTDVQISEKVPASGDETETRNETDTPDPISSTDIVTDEPTETVATEVATEIGTETAVFETVPEETSIPDTTVPVETEPEPTEPETTSPESAESENKRVPILMFHDLKREPGGTWSMSADNFKSTMEYILAAGFTPVDFRQLAGYVDGYRDLPEKPVCITFDDGYYSNYEMLLPIVTELQIPVTVFMTCGTLRPNGEVPEVETGELYKMSLYELGVMEASPYIDIQSHTWGLHGDNVTYGGTVRDNVLPLYGESEEVYKNVFRTDCDAASKVLLEAGVWAEIVYSYPSGKAHPWSEEVIKERGYFASLTTDFDAQNIVVRGDRDSLFLLGRMNVNDDTPQWELDYYLNRK